MTDETMADRRHRLLEPDRDAQVDEMRRKMHERGYSDLLQRFEGVMVEWQQIGDRDGFNHPIVAVLETATAEVKAAMTDLGVDPVRLASARVGSTLREDVSAQMVPFSDGSGLATISDAVLSLNQMYSQYAGSALSQLGSHGLRPLWRTVQAIRRNSVGNNSALLTGLLRYYNIHQRIFGLAGKFGWRVSPRAMDVAGLIQVQAVRFVIGHELSHHTLGHTSPVSAFSPDEHLPVCSDNQKLELEADELAYQAALRASERELAGTPAAGGADSIAFAGALIAMLSVHSTERALFVRPGCSHPPAASRAALLLRQLGQRQRTFAEIFLGDMLTATELSATFSDSSHPVDFVSLAASPEIETPHKEGYLRGISMLDALQCRPSVDLVNILARVNPASVGEGAQHVMRGDLRQGLASWGLSDERADQVLDPDRALAFHTLHENLRGSFSEQGMSDAESRTFTVAATQLFANAVNPES